MRSHGEKDIDIKADCKEVFKTVIMWSQMSNNRSENVVQVYRLESEWDWRICWGIYLNEWAREREVEFK